MKWNAYPAYKDSMLKIIGEIPEHWEIRRLKYVSHLAYGNPLPGEARIPGQYHVYGSNGPIGTHHIANTNGPCIIIGRKGSFGKVNYSECACFAIDTTFYIDNTLTNNNLKWFYYCLQWLRLDSFTKDSAIPGLAREDVYNKLVPYCKIKEQNNIVHYLSEVTKKIGSLVAKKEQQIELLKEKRIVIISNAVTKGLNPSVPMKDSEIMWIGEIPEHWKVIKFRRFTKLQQGLQIAQAERFAEPGPNRYEYITIQSIHSRNNSYKEYIDNPPQSVVCQPNDILLARTGATGEVITNQYGVFHNNFFKIKYNHKKVEKEYLVYYLSDALVKEHLLVLAGTTTVPDLGHGDFLDFQFLAPPLSEQSTIVDYLDQKIRAIDELKKKIEESINKLLEYRDSLIFAVVTGKIDVRKECS